MTDRPVDGRGTARAAGLPDGIPDDGTVPMPAIAFDALAGSSDWPARLRHRRGTRKGPNSLAQA